MSATTNDVKLSTLSLSTEKDPLDFRETPEVSPRPNFDLADAIDQIRKAKYTKLALQFPDNYLPYSADIARELTQSLFPDNSALECFILADTTHGSCCVDEIAAQHVNCDALLHFGEACMSKTTALPIIYIFEKATLDLPTFFAEFDKAYVQSSSVTLLLSRQYERYHPDILQELSASYEIHQQPSKNRPLAYVGMPPPSYVLNLSSQSSFTLLYDTSEHSFVKPTSLLARRYALVQKAKVCGVFGILIGTLGVEDELAMIEYLMKALKLAGKKGYIISIGKVRPEKVANFSEIECFCLLGCVFNSVLESTDYFRPIITPHELLLSLMRNSWSGDWITDFDTLLHMGLSSEIRNTDDDDEPEFSLVTGKYVSSSRPMSLPQDHETSKTSLSVRENGQLSHISGALSPAAAYLRERREWSGLGSDYATEDACEADGALVQEGLVGIAKGYSAGRESQKH